METTATKRSPIQRFLNLIKVDKQDIISIYVYTLFNGILILTLPIGIQAIINLIGGGQVSTSLILLISFVIAGVALTGVMQIIQLSISENLQQKIFTRSAFEFAYRIPKLKVEAVDKTHIPELVNRFFDTLAVQKGLSKILMDFSGAALQMVFGLVLLSLYHNFFILFSLLVLLLVYLIFRFTVAKGLKTSLTESKYKYEVAHWLEELAQSMETFKLAGSTPLPLGRTDHLVTGYLHARKSHFKTLLIQYINLVGFKVIITTGLLVIGGLLVINQQMNIGQFVAAEIIIIMVQGSVEKLILSMETIYDVLTAIEKIGAITDLPLDRDTGNRPAKSFENGISVSVKDYSYQFEGSNQPVLKNINLQIAEGEKICLAGTENSGKSILLQAVAGLYEEFDGHLSYASIPIANWCKEDLHSIIGENVVRDEIFNGSLMENITMGKPKISLDEVQNIGEIVGLNPYVETLQKGYETMLLTGGKSIPKSVRLRIILARCIIGSPALILIDDQFNQLNRTDRQRFINHILNSKASVIAVSNDHDLATRFNKTIVMNNGEIIATAPAQTMTNNIWFSVIFLTK